MRRRLAKVVVIAAGLLAGCAPGEPHRYRVSGEAKFDGQPIPYGDVLFTPDGAKGNSGPQGIAPIRDGRYDTAAAGGKGIAGGPTVLKITGLTGPGGKLLCEYELRVDLPRAASTHPIDVPKKGAAKPSQTPDI
jgi:hypothetical protein